MDAHRTERGQALVLIILAIVALFGFAALAVDMGRIFAERRRAQNAADSAALAASLALARGQNLSAAGLGIADTNGYNNDGVDNTVTVNYPPASGPYAGDDRYIQVIIWEHVDPIFSQLVYSGEEGFTVEAVTHLAVPSGVSGGDAVHHLSPYDNLELKGDVGVHITGGNLVSNGGWKKAGGSGTVRVYNSDGTIKGDGIQVGGDWVCTGCKEDPDKLKEGEELTVDPYPPTAISPRYVPEVDEPYCPDADETDEEHGVNYYVHTSPVGAGVLPPGIHCIEAGISLEGGETLTGVDVLLVMKGGGIKVKGTSTLALYRPDSIIDKNGHQYGGLLIYVPKDNPSTLTLGGNSGSSFSGTILSPAGECDMGGTSKGEANHVAIICNTIRFHGTTDVNIYYREEENYRLPPLLDISQ